MAVSARTDEATSAFVVVDGAAYPFSSRGEGDVGTSAAEDPSAVLRAPGTTAEQIARFAEVLRRRPQDAAPRELPSEFGVPFDVRSGLKVLALGRSYRAHAIELGNAPLERPIVFAKFAECMIGSGATVVIPEDAEGKMDHEAELAIVVGRDCRRLKEGEGLAAIAGYCIANDLTLRAVQSKAKQAGHPWLRAKNFPGSLPIGPWITPKSAVPRPEALVVTCRVNGIVRQQAPVSQMTWDVGRVVEEMSRLWPLREGNVISTGTPAGVGGLSPGDVCEIEIRDSETSLGVLVTRIAAS